MKEHYVKITTVLYILLAVFGVTGLVITKMVFDVMELYAK